MAMARSPKLHIAMYPWFAFGQMTPYLHLSNELAERGHKITFILPRKAQSQLQHLNLHPTLIIFYPLTIPHVDGLPPGAETASDVPNFLHHLLATAMDSTTVQVEAALRAMKPDLLLFDFPYLAPSLASKLGIKSIYYSAVCAAAFARHPVPGRQVSKDRPINACSAPMKLGWCNSCLRHLVKASTCIYKLAVAGEPVDEQRLVHILGGLGVECNPFVTSILARPASISLSELSTLLTSFHIRLKQQNTKVTLDVNQPSANLATATSPKPKSAPKYHGSQQGRFQFSARARGHGGNSRNEMGRGTRPRCQVCGKLDHLAISCYYRFDRNFQPPNNH
ncbi:hypothetical protein AAG906_027123 [Vitis piasezkii]